MNILFPGDKVKVRWPQKDAPTSLFLLWDLKNGCYGHPVLCQNQAPSASLSLERYDSEEDRNGIRVRHALDTGFREVLCD